MSKRREYFLPDNQDNIGLVEPKLTGPEALDGDLSPVAAPDHSSGWRSSATSMLTRAAAFGSSLIYGAQATVTQDAAGRKIYDFPQNFNGTTIIQAPTDVSSESMIKIQGEVFAGNALPREDMPNVWSLNGCDLTRVGNDLIITQAGIPATSSNNVTIKNFNFNAANEQLGISLNKAAQAQTHAIGTVNSVALNDRVFPLDNRCGRIVYLKKQTIDGNIILSAEICNRVGIPVSSQVLASLPQNNVGTGVAYSENDISTVAQAAQLPDGTIVFEYAVNQISRNFAGQVPTNPASNSSLCIAAISPDGSKIKTGVLATNRVRTTSGFIYRPSNIVLNADSSRMIATFTGVNSAGTLNPQNNIEFNENAQAISGINSGLEVPGFGAQNALSSFTLNTGDVVSVGQGTLSFSTPNLVAARNNTVDILVDHTLPQYFLPAQNCSVSISPAVDYEIPEIVIPDAPGATYLVNLNGINARLNLREIGDHGILSSEIGGYLYEAKESEILPQDALGKGAVFAQPNVNDDIHPVTNSSQSLYNPRFAVLQLPQGQKVIINGFSGLEIAQNYTRFFADTPTMLPTPSATLSSSSYPQISSTMFPEINSPTPQIAGSSTDASFSSAIYNSASPSEEISYGFSSMFSPTISSGRADLDSISQSFTPRDSSASFPSDFSSVQSSGRQGFSSDDSSYDYSGQTDGFDIYSSSSIVRTSTQDSQFQESSSFGYDARSSDLQSASEIESQLQSIPTQVVSVTIPSSVPVSSAVAFIASGLTAASTAIYNKTAAIGYVSSLIESATSSGFTSQAVESALDTIASYSLQALNATSSVIASSQEASARSSSFMPEPTAAATPFPTPHAENDVGSESGLDTVGVVGIALAVTAALTIGLLYCRHKLKQQAKVGQEGLTEGERASRVSTSNIPIFVPSDDEGSQLLETDIDNPTAKELPAKALLSNPKQPRAGLLPPLSRDETALPGQTDTTREGPNKDITGKATKLKGGINLNNLEI